MTIVRYYYSSNKNNINNLNTMATYIDIKEDIKNTSFSKI